MTKLTTGLKYTGALFAGLLLAGGVNAKRPKTPNIIYILADDLGYGDLSCYGQKRFSTPNIDQLAQKGVLFTQHYSGSTVCAPSRSSLMTGQHTGHTPIRGNREWNPEGQFPLIGDAVTVAELLKSKGYATGAFGKWGLGYPGSEGDPTVQGFDEFFGYNCQRLGHNYYPYHLWSNLSKLRLNKNMGKEEGTYAPNLIHIKTLNFIEKYKDQPFFCYVPTIIPHAELKVPENYLARFRGKLNPEKAYKGTDSGPYYKSGGYGSQPESHAAFAAMITLLDDHVGEIVAKVKELGIEDNTIIIFTSDNGPHLEGGADPDYFNSNGAFTGYKRDLYEGGIRVPFIASWPGQIPEGTINNHPSAFWDFLPTACDLAGIEVPDSIDGISYLPALLGRKQRKHNYLYWEFPAQGGKQAVRLDKWKGVRLNVNKIHNGPIMLFDLENDPAELWNVADRYPDVVEKIKQIMTEARKPSEDYPLHK
ncbi:arylsulfatase [Puteibacter caeruleilacunae]|nr:arylsulfatase [Puteibacter caeruleilacunae]